MLYFVYSAKKAAFLQKENSTKTSRRGGLRRLDIAFYRSADHIGKGTYVHADTIAKFSEIRIRTMRKAERFYCPSCGERVFFVKEAQHESNDKYRKGHGPHFAHQIISKCNNEDCELRAETYARDPGLFYSQRIRTPLFLRPNGAGRFVLSLGFATANKEALKNLQQKKFNSLRVGQGSTRFAQVSLETLLREEGEGIHYIDLPAAIARGIASNISLVEHASPIKPERTEPLKEGMHPDWAAKIDWFKDPNAGAIFQYSAGNAGEKIPTGSCILSERPYLIAEKKVSSGVLNISEGKLQRFASEFGTTCQLLTTKVASLLLPGSAIA